MRGNAYSRLRRSLARALRRAIAGSTALAIFVIGVVTLVLVGSDRSEARTVVDTPRASAAAIQPLDRLAGPPPDQSVDSELAPDAVVESIVPDLVPALDDIELPTADAIAPREGNRRVGVAAIGQAAGTQSSSSTSDRPRLQHIPWDDGPVIVEPPYSTITETPAVPPSPPLGVGDVIEATISFYYCEQGDTANGGDGGGFCGAMRDGTVVYEGAAACAYVYLGQQFRVIGDPTERIYTCHDTGSAVHGLHRDIFFHRAADGWPWLLSVGTQVSLEIVG